MTTPPMTPVPETFELTIVGALGPALRNALRPHLVARPRPVTVLRVTGEDAESLAEVVGRFERAHIEVDAVLRAGSPPVGEARPAEPAARSKQADADRRAQPSHEPAARVPTDRRQQ